MLSGARACKRYATGTVFAHLLHDRRGHLGANMLGSRRREGATLRAAISLLRFTRSLPVELEPGFMRATLSMYNLGKAPSELLLRLHR